MPLLSRIVRAREFAAGIFNREWVSGPDRRPYSYPADISFVHRMSLLCSASEHSTHHGTADLLHCQALQVLAYTCCVSQGASQTANSDAPTRKASTILLRRKANTSNHPPQPLSSLSSPAKLTAGVTGNIFNLCHVNHTLALR